MRRVVTRFAMVLGAVGVAAGVALPATGAFATGPSAASSSFVIGDGNSSVGAQVEFWGAQWAKDNTVSGGGAPHSFKGWAVTVDLTGSCSGTFSTDPGNSSDPPGSIPAQITVLVTSDVTKHGNTISGTFSDIATVNTDSGYAGDPGHAGTGTVVSLCSQSGSTGGTGSGSAG